MVDGTCMACISIAIVFKFVRFFFSIAETDLKNSFRYKDIFNNLAFHQFDLTENLPPKSPFSPEYTEDLEFVQQNGSSEKSTSPNQ